jgi:hypothetical protein
LRSSEIAGRLSVLPAIDRPTEEITGTAETHGMVETRGTLETGGIHGT